MANSNALTINWYDVGGVAAKMTILVAASVLDPSGAAAATITAAIAAVSKAVSVARTLSFYASVSDTAAQASYGDNEDKAALKFKDEDGQYHVYEIPAPLSSIFLADGKTIDSANSAVLDLISVVTGTCVTKAGRAITSFVGGKRVRKDKKG